MGDLMERELCATVPTRWGNRYRNRLEDVQRALAEADSRDREADRLRAQADQIRKGVAERQPWFDVWADPSRWVERHERLPGLRCGGDCCLHHDDLDCPRHKEPSWRDWCPEIGTQVGTDRDGWAIYARMAVVVDGFDPYVVWKSTYGEPTGGPVCVEGPQALTC